MVSSTRLVLFRGLVLVPLVAPAWSARRAAMADDRQMTVGHGPHEDDDEERARWIAFRYRQSQNAMPTTDPAA